MQTVAINGTLREATGKVSSKSARKEDLIPCVMYGGEENVHFTTTFKDVKTLIYTPDFKVAEITVNGETTRCILKDIQFHPVKNQYVELNLLLDEIECLSKYIESFLHLRLSLQL